MENVTMIASGKGGVGKSTLSICLGLTLSNMGRRVLLLDMDAGLGSLEHMLGISEELVYDVADIIKGNCTVMKAIYKNKNYENLFLLPAPRNSKDALNQNNLKQLILVLSKYYDHILLDCPAGVGRGFMSAVGCCNKAILVANPNPISLIDIQKVKRLLIKYEVKEYRLVINRFDKKLFKKSKIYDDFDAVIDQAGVQLIGIIPEDSQTMLRLANGSLPSNDVPSSKAFERLALRLEGNDIRLPSLRRL